MRIRIYWKQCLTLTFKSHLIYNKLYQMENERFELKWEIQMENEEFKLKWEIQIKIK